MKAEMKKWIKRGMALLLTGMVILAGAGTCRMEVRATETSNAEDEIEKGEGGGTQPSPTTSDNNVVIKEVIKEVPVEVDPGPSSTSEFLTLSDTFQTPTVTHGATVVIGLPVVNYSTVPLNDVVVRPRISNKVDEWPFEPNAAGATKTIKQFPAYDNKKNIEDFRQELGFAFVVREDVKSGYYKLEFDVTYLRNNQVEKGVLTTYVKAVGTKESGSLEGDDEEDEKNASKPRIIVTGFETSPAQVYAGETFTLTIHVKNTSQTSEVTNVLFDMQAKEEGKDEDSKFAAFLPTSGSSSVYADSIAPGASKDLVIEMSAKSDLSQKPYVLDVNMKYDAKDAVDLTDKASVSIPIYQEQRCETGDAEVLPANITVGGQTNITFDVYNTGKTTLYNVWVKFQGDSVTGGDTFLGTIASGATGSVDTMVTGAAPTTDGGKIKAIVSYENESGVVSTLEKELELFVTEEMMEDFSDPAMGMEGGMDMEEPESSGKKFILPAVIAAVVLLLAVVVVVVRIRKKKKEQAELTADLEALDDGRNKF